MSVDTRQLADRLTEAIRSGTADGENAAGWLWRALLCELARGRPVTVDDLARVTGRSAAEARDGLAGLSDTEYDEQGRVVGHGITLRPTPHRFTVDGRRLYTWCALDTLIFPTVIGQPAQVVSPTPGSGEPVRLEVDPATGVTALDPETAVVSVLVPDRTGDGVRSAFCNRVHFFATPDAAQQWLAEHPGGTLLPVGEASDLGRTLAEDLLAEKPGCC
jgi:alkylmercury lyase